MLQQEEFDSLTWLRAQSIVQKYFTCIWYVLFIVSNGKLYFVKPAHSLTFGFALDLIV